MQSTHAHRQEPDGTTGFDSTTNYGRTGPRPTYFLLGIDAAGSHHVMDTLTDSVHIITPTGTREHRQSLNGHAIEAYMDTIREGPRGWAEECYGVGIGGLVERALDR